MSEAEAVLSRGVSLLRWFPDAPSLVGVRCCKLWGHFGRVFICVVSVRLYTRWQRLGLLPSFCLFIWDFVVQAKAVLALQHGEFVRVDDAWDREVISATVLGTSPPKRVPRSASAAGRAAAGRANAGTGIATSASTRAGGGEPRFASPAQSRPPVAPDCREYVLRSKCARNALPSALVRVVGRWILRDCMRPMCGAVRVNATGELGGAPDVRLSGALGIYHIHVHFRK